jgi:hypothetical protein
VRVYLILSLGLLGAFCPAGAAYTQDGDGPPPEFQRAYRAAASRQYDAALAILDDVLKQGSHTRNALFSAGSIAMSAGQFPRARDYLLKLRDLEPRSGQVRAALVRANQGLGDLEARDRERRELLRLRGPGGDPALAAEDSFARDEFAVAGCRVVALEFFELKGDRALRYAFLIFRPNSQRPDYRISLGSYAATDAVWRATRKPAPKPGERLFHLDGYFSDGSHATFGMHHPEPGYDAVREMVIKIVQEHEGRGTTKP